MSAWIKASVRAMSGYVPGEQPGTDSFIKLNTNENPYPPSPAVGAALRNLDPAALRLYPDPLSTRLRQALADLHGCSVDQVFAGNGSDEVLALCTRAFVEDGGAIGYFQPSYGLYPVLAAIRDVPGRGFPLGPAFEWRPPDLDRVSLLFLANPHSPTGLLFPIPDVEALCARASGVVVIDEAYADFARDNALALALRLPNVLVVRTFSKSYALAGLRVGYAVGSAELVAALFKIKDSYNLDRLSQTLALAALSDRPYMLRMVERIRATRRRSAEALERLGFRVWPSDANFLWVRPPKPPAANLFARLRERRILVRHFPGPLTEDYLRITVGTDDQMDRLLEAVVQILGET